MKMTFRWYGKEQDPIPLEYVKQIPGMSGLMGLLDKPAGVVWEEEEIKALVDEVDKQLSEAGEPPMRREGLRSDIWVLMDFGCVIVHVFTDEARKFYNLERLWSDAEVVDVSSLPSP